MSLDTTLIYIELQYVTDEISYFWVTNHLKFSDIEKQLQSFILLTDL